MIAIIPAIVGVTATTTSDKFFVGDAKRIGFLCRRANHSSGSTAFSVNVSLEHRDTPPASLVMTAFNLLFANATNTSSQSIAMVSSISLAANGDAYMWALPAALIQWVSCTVTETTDGTHSMYIVAEY